MKSKGKTSACSIWFLFFSFGIDIIELYYFDEHNLPIVRWILIQLCFVTQKMRRIIITTPFKYVSKPIGSFNAIAESLLFWSCSKWHFTLYESVCLLYYIEREEKKLLIYSKEFQRPSIAFMGLIFILFKYDAFDFHWKYHCNKVAKQTYKLGCKLMIFFWGVGSLIH